MLNINPKSFQLEQSLPGTFILQGWLGGFLAGFVYTVAICFVDEHIKFDDALVAAAFIIPLVTPLSVTKSTIMWAPYRLAKFQPRAVTRVAITSICTGAFAFATGRLHSNDHNDWIPWVVVLILGGLPTTILVGSNWKPWELFTFGSIAGRRPRTVLGTLATLPLRFLSLFALALWILYIVCLHESVWSLEIILFFVLPTVYLVLSAAITFKSPRRAILLIVGLCANIPVSIVGFFSHAMFPETYRVHDTSLLIMALCGTFVGAWAIFLIARLTVRTESKASLTSVNSVMSRSLDKRDHECLGSRFVNWQQHTV